MPNSTRWPVLSGIWAMGGALALAMEMAIAIVMAMVMGTPRRRIANHARDVSSTDSIAKRSISRPSLSRLNADEHNFITDKADIALFK